MYWTSLFPSNNYFSSKKTKPNTLAPIQSKLIQNNQSYLVSIPSQSNGRIRLDLPTQPQLLTLSQLGAFRLQLDHESGGHIGPDALVHHQVAPTGNRPVLVLRRHCVRAGVFWPGAAHLQSVEALFRPKRVTTFTFEK